MKIIGLTGFAGVGKDTVADHLVSKHGCVKYALAGPLKAMLRAIGVECDNRETKELPHPTFGVSPRVMAQTLGTEWMRKCVAEDGWLRLARDYITVTREGNRYADEQTYIQGIVFTDVRFENEAEFIRGEGGTVIHVWRDVGKVSAHASEKGVEFNPSDRAILNDKTTDITFRRLDDIISYL